MSGDVNIRRRQWGKSEITGGRHAFRIGMVLREFKRRSSPPQKVLDAGCGDGSLTVGLIESGYEVSAVDSSGLCVERLRRKIDFHFDPDPPAVTSCIAGLEALPFPDQSFDAAVSGEVLEHLDDDETAVKELYRVLRPGGICLVTVPANPYLWGLDDEWAGHKRRYLKSDLVRLFEMGGFEPVNVHHWGWPVTWVYNRVVFRRWLRKAMDAGDPEASAAGAAATHPAAVAIMLAAFSIDRLFFRLPFGIGLIGVFRKVGAE